MMPSSEPVTGGRSTRAGLEVLRAATNSPNILRDRFPSSRGVLLRLAHQPVIHPQCQFCIHAVRFAVFCTSCQLSFCGQRQHQRSGACRRGVEVVQALEGLGSCSSRPWKSWGGSQKSVSMLNVSEKGFGVQGSGGRTRRDLRVRLRRAFATRRMGVGRCKEDRLSVTE